MYHDSLFQHMGNAVCRFFLSICRQYIKEQSRAVIEKVKSKKKMYENDYGEFEDSMYSNVYEANMYDDQPYIDPKDLVTMKTPQGEVKTYYQDESGHFHSRRISSYYDAPEDPEKAAEQGFLTVQDVIHDLESEGDTVYHEDEADSKFD